MKISVLGSEYTLEVIPAASMQLKSRQADGYCDSSTRQIYVSDCSDADFGDPEGYIKLIKRHEIIHAFLNESGLQSSWEHPCSGQEETVVDWIAIQFPKLIEAFKAADAL